MKKELIEQNKNLSFNIVDVLSHMDPTKTNKFLPLLVKEFKNSRLNTFNNEHLETIKNHKDDYYNSLAEYSGYTTDELIARPRIFVDVISSVNGMFSGNFFYDKEHTKEVLEKFDLYCNRNLIPEKDIQKYQSLSDVFDAVLKAEVNALLVDADKQVQKLYDDENWFLVRPLTYESSIKYGYATRWCTSMKSSPEYFNRYSENYVLLYAISKNTREKVGIVCEYLNDCDNQANSNSNPKRAFRFFNNEDDAIDSTLTNLPNGILDILKDVKKTYLTNYQYMLAENPSMAEKFMADKNAGYEKKCYVTEADGPAEPMPQPELVARPIQGYQEDDPGQLGAQGTIGIKELEGLTGVVNNMDEAIEMIKKHLGPDNIFKRFYRLFKKKNTLVFMGLPERYSGRDFDTDGLRQFNGYYFIVYTHNGPEIKIQKL